MVYAIYRVLYGEDFIQESILSILDNVDRVFIFWDDTPWGDVKSCVYKGNVVKFPRKFDNVIEKVKELNCSKIEITYDHRYNNINQMTNLVNERILPCYKQPEIIVFIEPDHVFKSGDFKKALDFFKVSPHKQMTTSQIEIWKGFKNAVPTNFRKNRLSVVLTKLNGEKMPNTGRHCNIKSNLKRIPVPVYNFGFAVSQKAMYWKIMIAIGISQKIGDSPPNQNWYEEKWLNWKEGIKNLEPALNFEYMIPMVSPYDINLLPKSILKKIQ